MIKLFVLIFTILAGIACPSLVAAYENVALGKPVSISTNGADGEEYSVYCSGYEPSDVTDGLCNYVGCDDDGTVAYGNETYNELMVVEVTIDLQGVYDVSAIRYNMGDVQRANTWNADTMTTAFGSSSTNPGGSYVGSWTEHTGAITMSKVTIVLEKTRTSWATDWLTIGEIEVYGTPVDSRSAGDFDNDGDIDSDDLASFSAIFGKGGWSDSVISLTGVPILNQNDYVVTDSNGLIGSGGCVPVSFAMLFISYFNSGSFYGLELDLSPLSQNTINIIETISNHLDAFVQGGSTWVDSHNILERMQDYTVTIDTNSTPESVYVNWEIEYMESASLSNQEIIDFVKGKLSVGESVYFSGHIETPTGCGGHSSIISGYKNVFGAEYFRIHDTYSNAESKWWKILKNRSLTIDSSNYNGLIRLDTDNSAFQYFMIGYIANPKNMIVTPSY
jgi:hypothetical protein